MNEVLFWKMFSNILINSFLEVILTILVLNKLADMKIIKKKSRYIIAGCIFSLPFVYMLSGNSISGNSIGTNVIYTFIVQLLIILVIFREKTYKKILMFFCYYSCAGAIVSIITNAVSIILSIKVITLQANLFFNFILSLIIVGVIMLATWGIKKLNINKIPWYYLLIMTVTMICWTGIFEYLNLAKDKQIENKNINIILVCAILVGILMMLVIVYLILIDISRKHLVEEKLWQEEVVNIQKNEYNRIYEREVRNRKFRHDYKMHLVCMNSLAKEDQNEKLIEYIGQLSKNLELFSDKMINVGNEIVNVILNQLYSEAEKKNIQINVRGCILKDIKIREIDLCSIFYNALSNAIEACDKHINDVKKIINIQIKTYNSALYIAIDNPINIAIDMSVIGNGTTKEDKENHGFGIMILKEIAGKYEGDVDFEIFNNRFLISIVLHNIY